MRLKIVGNMKYKESKEGCLNGKQSKKNDRAS